MARAGLPFSRSISAHQETRPAGHPQGPEPAKRGQWEQALLSGTPWTRGVGRRVAVVAQAFAQMPCDASACEVASIWQRHSSPSETRRSCSLVRRSYRSRFDALSDAPALCDLNDVLRRRDAMCVRDDAISRSSLVCQTVTRPIVTSTPRYRRCLLPSVHAPAAF